MAFVNIMVYINRIIMKKKMAAIAVILSTILMAQCNNSATGNTSSDTASAQIDTVKTPVVTEGGLRDSIETGATDSTKKKDSIKK